MKLRRPVSTAITSRIEGSPEADAEQAM